MNLETITHNSTTPLPETTLGTANSTLNPQPLTSNIAISVHNVSKMYPLYARPSDRLKQSLWYVLPQFLRGQPRQFYREFWALRDISFEVKKGEALGIIGKNGSGKSTLLQIIAGTLTPTSGEVQTNGRVAALLELGSGFNPEFTGRENVYLNGSILGFSREDMDQLFDKIAAFADIGQFIDQPVKIYSSGMFVRLAFAVQACVEPDILVVDEALAVGDVFFRQKCYKRLEALRDRGVAIILVSHAILEVEQFCEQAVLLHNAQAVFLGGAPEAVKRYYLLEQGERKMPGVLLPELKSPNSQQIASGTSLPESYFWPPQEAFLDISGVSQVSTDAARCTGVALCNEQGQPCHVFQQGETASFFYEFELLRDIEVPIGGVVLQNEKGVIVHGKNTLHYDSQVPIQVERGSRLRFQQDISLEIATGQYTFEAGLATISHYDYKNRGFYSNADLATKTIRLCHLPSAGHFAVTLRRKGMPVQLLHHGVANLAGNCQVMIVEPDGVTSQPVIIANSQRGSADIISDNFWPPAEAHLTLSDIPQSTDGKVRCTKIAICDDQGKATTTFHQGQQAHFFYEFEVLEAIEVPSAGLLLHNEEGQVVFGKNSFQYGLQLPDRVPKGTQLRLHQKITLELSPGIYFFTVELASAPHQAYTEYQADRMGDEKFILTVQRHCSVTNIGSITVGYSFHGKLSHYGMANLPGICHLSILPSSPSFTPSVVVTTPSKDQLPREADETPTIFHITHQKAGSQWLHKILLECAPERIVAPKLGNLQFQSRPIQAGKIYPTLYITYEQFKTVQLPRHWYRFVIIRDLRDTMISGYFSKKVSHPLVGQTSEVRDILHLLSLEDGLMWIMEKWLPRCARIQTSWLLTGEPLLRYEDLLENDLEILEHVLLKEGKLSISREKLEAAVLANRFERLTGRQRGQEDIEAHERKGMAGDWRNSLNDRLKRSFKELYGGLLIATGYEKDLNW